MVTRVNTYKKSKSRTTRRAPRQTQGKRSASKPKPKPVYKRQAKPSALQRSLLLQGLVYQSLDKAQKMLYLHQNKCGYDMNLASQQEWDEFINKLNN